MRPRQRLIPGTTKRKRISFLVFIILLPLLQSCNAVTIKDAESPKLAAPNYQDQLKGEYRIQVGDLLEIKFFNNSDLDQEARVRPDGRISLQLIDEIVVSGLTPLALKKIINSKYSNIIRDDKISVIVHEFMPQKVFVIGEVYSATEVSFTGPLTVLQALAYAGGFTDTAKEESILVIRRSAGSPAKIFQTNLKKVIDGSDLSQDILLEPYDIIYVP